MSQSQSKSLEPNSACSELALLQKKRTKRSSVKRKEQKKKKMTREKMKEGDSIRSEHFLWKITKLLGSGGFGDVYKVHKDGVESDKNEYAMKTEMVEGKTQMLRLKIEVTVLKQCWECDNPEIKKHFVEFVDRGITPKFKFMVMGLVGPSLEDVRRKFLQKNFSRPAALNTSIQTLDALAALHNVGWIHRDIKPQNYAVGLGEKEDTIYLLDFGIARPIFVANTREVKPPRIFVKFLGTLRFASRACHTGAEQGRKDDLETWLYMVYDLFDFTYGLPWKRSTDRKEVLKLKVKFFQDKTATNLKCYRRVPKEFKGIADYLDTLGYSEEPDYKKIKDIMITVGNERYDKNWEKILDWRGKLNKKKDDRNNNTDDTSSDNRQSGESGG